MRKIKEVLRLHAEGRLSGRGIGRVLGISPATVIDYLGRARVANLTWPVPPVGLTTDLAPSGNDPRH